MDPSDTSFYLQRTYSTVSQDLRSTAVMNLSVICYYLVTILLFSNLLVYLLVRRLRWTSNQYLVKTQLLLILLVYHCVLLLLLNTHYTMMIGPSSSIGKISQILFPVAAPARKVRATLKLGHLPLYVAESALFLYGKYQGNDWKLMTPWNIQVKCEMLSSMIIFWMKIEQVSVSTPITELLYKWFNHKNRQ